MIDAIRYRDVVKAVSEEQKRYSARLVAFDGIDAASQQAMIASPQGQVLSFALG